MQKTTFKIFVACLLAVIATSTHAQIVLHEATDVTQTKATLSADFPDLSVEHGFQYKYGTLPEIDDFSKLALSAISDPVQINTTGTNAWSARTVKGWVESKSNLYVGQTSVMSAKVKFSEPTTVTFEWSVDSEEGIGILSFIVDGETVYEISGEVGFTQVSYQAAAGEHTLQWQYKKTAATNVGLDLGMVRNIDLQNTTEGEWITKNTGNSSLSLLNLYPEQNYLYRGYSGEFANDASFKYSPIKTFSSLPILFKNVSVDPITQSTANINMEVDYGDTQVELGFDILNNTSYENIEFAKRLLAEDTYGCNMLFNDLNYSQWHISKENDDFNCVSSESTLSITVTLERPTTITFEWTNTSPNGACSPSFYVDETRYGWGKSYRLYNSENFKEYSFVIPEGTHTLKWYGGSNRVSLDVIYYGRNYLRKLSIPGLDRELLESIVLSSNGNGSYKKEQLTSNTTYHLKPFVRPTFESELPYGWIEPKIEQIAFVTLPVYSYINNTVSTLKQASATIRGKVDGGDATIIATGLQYKDAMGTRWTDYPKDVTETDLSQNITRLKPSTTYHYRSYIQAQDCDTVFSEVGEFTTLAVEALKPAIVRLTQYQAELQGEVCFGDASIYQRGIQFRKQGEKEWEEIEDGGNKSIFTLVKKGLEMSTTYEARTYVQPAGCDMIYSDILTFKTAHYVSDVSNPEVKRTQTTAVVTFMLSDTDDEIEEAGIYYGSDSNKEQWKQVSGVMEGNVVKVTIPNLKYNARYYYRPYVKVNGQYYFYDDMGNNASFVTKDITATMTFPVITQTTVQIKADIDAGDANVTGWGYCFGDSYDSENFCPYEELTEIRNLSINKKYNIGLFCIVDGEYKLIASGDFTTKDVTVSALFFNVTQTKAQMRITVNSGDAEVTDFKYCLDYGDKVRCGDFAFFSGLIPNMTHTVSLYGTINGVEHKWGPHLFTTEPVSVSARASDVEQTSATISKSYNFGDATYVSSGMEYGTTTSMTENASSEESEMRLTELLPNTTYYYSAYVEVKEGGKIYSSRNSFKTPAIICTTSPVSNISNRSATMNGTIDCDGYSSAEFGFQWKQMEGWNSDPAFTKGVKNEDGSISVALVNGMLEPNTDYQYRAAVRYKGNIYYASNWETFRTESEFVYYPASVYTIYRTDRENNCLILCGYYVAGSEEIVAQGYEYWNTSSSARSSKAYAVANNVIQVTTDESMQYSLDLKALADGNYSIRAFVKTSSGNTIYGNTLAFGVQGGNVTGIDNVETTNVKYSIFNHILTIYNAANLSCAIYNLQGQTVEHRLLATDCEQFYLVPGNVYIIRLSNGMTYKVRI